MRHYLLPLVLLSACDYRSGNESVVYLEMPVKVEQPFLDSLSVQYQTYSVSPDLPEYAYCVNKFQMDYAHTVPTLTVSGIQPAYTDNATPEGISVDCGSLPVLHSHPPTLCGTHLIHCRAVEPNTIPNLCEPSNDDLKAGAESDPRILIIQCGPDNFRGFLIKGEVELNLP